MKRVAGCWLVVCLLGLATPCVATTHAIIVAGLGGEPEYEEAFRRQAGALHAGLAEVATQPVLLMGSDATADAVREIFTDFAARAGSADQLIFVYVGHGSFDGEKFRFNVPGADFSATDLGSWLEPFTGAQLLIVASSSSGAVLEILAAERRTLLTATRSGDQSNATVFARYLVEALQEMAADVDKNKLVSVAEAYEHAAAGVANHYESRNLMASENPQMLGAGDAFTLARFTPEVFVAPELASLLERRDRLEASVNELRAAKSTMAQDDYYARLQTVLLELAVLEKQLAQQGGSP